MSSPPGPGSAQSPDSLPRESGRHPSSSGIPRPSTLPVTLPVHAYAFATTFRLRELASIFNPDAGAGETLLEKDCLAVVLDRAQASRLRIVVLFDF
ncbi:MAG TPA: hypothetical protein PKI03_32375, partial [Pseudomonadota bacterium]|nr:hypothetical protein [Pseudomonadota bacterium]